MPVKNFIRPTTDGRLACENDERAFWQSRMTRGGKAAPLPEIASVEDLARDLAKPARVVRFHPALAAPYSRSETADAPVDVYRVCTTFFVRNDDSVPAVDFAALMRAESKLQAILNTARKETTP